MHLPICRRRTAGCSTLELSARSSHEVKPPGDWADMGFECRADAERRHNRAAVERGRHDVAAVDDEDAWQLAPAGRFVSGPQRCFIRRDKDDLDAVLAVSRVGVGYVIGSGKEGIEERMSRLCGGFPRRHRQIPAQDRVKAEISGGYL